MYLAAAIDGGVTDDQHLILLLRWPQHHQDTFFYSLTTSPFMRHVLRAKLLASAAKPAINFCEAQLVPDSREPAVARCIVPELPPASGSVTASTSVSTAEPGSSPSARDVGHGTESTADPKTARSIVKAPASVSLVKQPSSDLEEMMTNPKMCLDYLYEKMDMKGDQIQFYDIVVRRLPSSLYYTLTNSNIWCTRILSRRSGGHTGLYSGRGGNSSKRQSKRYVCQMQCAPHLEAELGQRRFMSRSRRYSSGMRMTGQFDSS